MHSSSFQDSLLRFKAQPVLFAEKLKQLSLRQVTLPEETPRRITVNVWRNHTFESVANLTQIFARAYGFDLKFNHSDYDDSLLFTDHMTADIELLWLNPRSYSKELPSQDWAAWLEDRLQSLRHVTSAPILIATWSDGPAKADHVDMIARKLPDVYFANLQTFAESRDLELINERTEELSGSPLSASAQLALSRTLFCTWLSALALPPVKAIAVDLDNTLHDGVLGEDGIDGITVGTHHKALQNKLLAYKERGIFLALVSRNEPEDVQSLLRQNDQYVLQEKDFSAFCVSWKSKSEALHEIAAKLRIGEDAILFVDDNIGELAEVSVHLPNVQLIAADQDASVTARALEYHPALWRWKVSNEDLVRASDLAANEKRESLKSVATNSEEYFRNIGACLDLHRNSETLLERLTSMSGKTNQFNLALRRLDATAIKNAMNNPEFDVIAVGMRDNLSESGIIAFVLLHKEGTCLNVKELCISCRAMGRGLENTIIGEAIRYSGLLAQCDQIGFEFIHAPRNAPALKWLENFTDCQLSDGMLTVTIPKMMLDRFPPEKGVRIEK